MINIFVYGTLKKGQYWHDKYLNSAKFIGTGLCDKSYTLYIDALPFLVKEDSKDMVQGEVYQISEEILKSLDKLECCPILVDRDVVAIKLESGETIKAWTYVHENKFKGRKGPYKEVNWE